MRPQGPVGSGNGSVVVRYYGDGWNGRAPRLRGPWEKRRAKLRAPCVICYATDTHSGYRELGSNYYYCTGAAVVNHTAHAQRWKRGVINIITY